MTGSMFDNMAAVASSIVGNQFPDTLSIERPTTTKSTSGGNKPAYAVVSTNPTNIPCFYMPFRYGQEKTAGEKVRATERFDIFMPTQVSRVAVNIQDKDRLVIAARGNEPQRTLYIDSINREAGVMLEVVASREG